MIIRELDFELTVPRDAKRSKGVHLSDVIRDIALRSGYLDKKYAGKDIDEDPEFIMLGMAWEHIVLEMHPNILPHPMEYCLDRIYMSPDGITTGSKYDLEIHEIKLTKKSRPGKASDLATVGKWWMYLTQIKGYLKAIESRQAYLHVGFVNDNYSFFRSRSNEEIVKMMSYKIYDLEFKQHEIDENWRMMVNHRKLMIEEGKFRHLGLGVKSK